MSDSEKDTHRVVAWPLQTNLSEYFAKDSKHWSRPLSKLPKQSPAVKELMKPKEGITAYTVYYTLLLQTQLNPHTSDSIYSQENNFHNSPELRKNTFAPPFSRASSQNVLYELE